MTRQALVSPLAHGNPPSSRRLFWGLVQPHGRGRPMVPDEQHHRIVLHIARASNADTWWCVRARGNRGDAECDCRPSKWPLSGCEHTLYRPLRVLNHHHEIVCSTISRCATGITWSVQFMVSRRARKNLGTVFHLAFPKTTPGPRLQELE